MPLLKRRPAESSAAYSSSPERHSDSEHKRPIEPIQRRPTEPEYRRPIEFERRRPVEPEPRRPVETEHRRPRRLSQSRVAATPTVVSTRPSDVSMSRLGSSSTQFVESRVPTKPFEARPPEPQAAPAPEPHTPTEQYWAARAVHAEALLAAKTAHQADLKRVAYSEEVRRTKEMRILRADSEARHTKLERVIMFLVVSLLAMSGSLTFSLLPQAPKEELKAFFNMPHHLTIPILSPFASVVEQETAGLLSGRVLLACVPFFAVLTFIIVRAIWQSLH